MNASKSGITIAGSIIADKYHEIDTYPSLGFLTHVHSTRFNVGGVGNIILDLAKLDSKLQIKVCTIVGNDDAGEHIIKALKAFPNINTEGVTIEGESSVTLVMNPKDTKQRTFFYIPGASDVFDESYIDWNKADSKIFHLEYLLLMKKVDSPDEIYGTHGAKILKLAKDRGMITSIDMVSEQSDRVRSAVIPALKYTDICCINESEAEAVTGINIIENGNPSDKKAKEAMQSLKELGVSRWIVVHSPKIGYGYDCFTNEFVSVDSLNLPKGFIKGTTGAGDAYCAGILYGAYTDMSLSGAMVLARATAACSLSESNGTDGMLPFSEAIRMNEKYK